MRWVVDSRYYVGRKKSSVCIAPDQRRDFVLERERNKLIIAKWEGFTHR